MKFYSKKRKLLKKKLCRGFSLLEVVVAVGILAVITVSVLTVMNRCIEATIDLRMKKQAFDLARENMENLLASEFVSEEAEFGYDEDNPDLTWETIVEPFYEPITGDMWIQGVCTASYIDSKNETQTVQLTHWLTNLTKAQIKQILDQQKRELEFLEKFDLSNEDKNLIIALSGTTGLSLEEAYQIIMEQDKSKAIALLAELLDISYDDAETILEKILSRYADKKLEAQKQYLIDILGLSPEEAEDYLDNPDSLPPIIKNDPIFKDPPVEPTDQPGPDSPKPEKKPEPDKPEKEPKRDDRCPSDSEGWDDEQWQLWESLMGVGKEDCLKK